MAKKGLGKSRLASCNKLLHFHRQHLTEGITTMCRSIVAAALATALLAAGGCAKSSKLAWEPVAVPADASAALSTAAQGSIVEIPALDLNPLPEIAWQKNALDSPQYLISDDPEYIRVPEAVAMRESVDPGAVRLYVYNVNGVKEPAKIPRRISAVIANDGDGPMTLAFSNYAFRPPTTNYYHAGKNGLADFFSAKNLPAPRTIGPGESMPIDEAMEAAVANYDDLVHGFYEFTIDQPATISVVQTDPGTPSTVANARIDAPLPTKSHSGAGRGKFLTANFDVAPADGYVLDTTHGAVQLVVADGKKDPWVRGTESTLPGTEAVLAGNYGVIYDIEVPYTTTDGRGIAVVTWNARYNPKAWCGAMAATVVANEGDFPAGIVQLPSDELATKSAPECVLIQRYPALAPGETGTIRIRYSPPGASCLPTPLVFVPIGE